MLVSIFVIVQVGKSWVILNGLIANSEQSNKNLCRFAKLIDLINKITSNRSL